MIYRIFRGKRFRCFFAPSACRTEILRHELSLYVEYSDIQKEPISRYNKSFDWLKLRSAPKDNIDLIKFNYIVTNINVAQTALCETRHHL